jgi:hypothetical protein
MNRIRHNTTTHGILTAAAKSGMYYLASWQDGLSKAMVSGSLQALGGGGTSPSSGSTLASLILRPIFLPRRNSPLSLQDAPLPCF